MTESSILDAGPKVPTREALLRSALHLIGERGFDGASTRGIADAAGTNVASVAYHFGSKTGLYRACGAAIASMLANALAARGEPVGGAGMDDPVNELAAVLRRLAAFLFGNDQSTLVVPFLVREISAPGKAFEEIYDGVMEPFHKRMCKLWADAVGGDPECMAHKITVFSIVGQLLYFRVASLAVARRLGKTGIGEAETAAICDTIESNLRARVALERSLQP